MTPAPRGSKGIDINSALMEELTIHQNVRQELVVTTVDKLKICLMEHRHDLVAGREWIGMVGLTLSLAGTLVAATFNEKWLPAATWEALYLLCAIGAGTYGIFLMYRAIRAALRGGIDGLIDKIAKRASPGEGLFVDPHVGASLAAEFVRMMGEESQQMGPNK